MTRKLLHQGLLLLQWRIMTGMQSMQKGWNGCYGNGIGGVLFWSDGSTGWLLFWELGGNYVLSMLKLLMPCTGSDCWEILLLHGRERVVCIGELEIARSLLLINRKPMRSLLLCLWNPQVGIVRRLTTDASVYKICGVMWISCRCRLAESDACESL